MGRHPLILFLLVFATAAQAATLRTGKDFPAGPAAPRAAAPRDSGKSDNLDSLFSAKSFEQRAALKLLAEKAEVLAAAGELDKKHVERAAELLGAGSESVGAAAQDAFARHAGLFFDKGWLTADTVAALAKAAYLSEAGARNLTGLLGALLAHEQTAKLVTREHAFQAIDALDGKEPATANAGRDLLARHGAELATRGAWTATHTRTLLRKFAESRPENKEAFLKVLGANLTLWAQAGFFTADDLRKALSLKSLPDDAEYALVEFLAAPETVSALSLVNFYDRKWVDSLIADFKGGGENAKETARILLTRLMRAFAIGKSFTGADFKAIWNLIAAHLSGEDPFGMVTENIDPLVKSGWLGRSEYEKLVANFASTDPAGQKNILKFLNEHYERFSERGWISAMPLAPVVLSESGDAELKTLKLTLLHDHPDLVAEKSIFGSEELAVFVKNLGSKNGTIFELALGVLDAGFDTWAKEGILSTPILNDILGLEPANVRTAKVLEVLAGHFDHNTALFDKNQILRLSEFGFSPHDRVVEATEDFFVKHYKLMDKNRLTSPKLRQNLVKADIWENLPKKTRKTTPRYGKKGRGE